MRNAQAMFSLFRQIIGSSAMCFLFVTTATSFANIQELELFSTLRCTDNWDLSAYCVSDSVNCVLAREP